MNSVPSILMITVFFGSWPKWMPAFLESCRLNADIEWLLLGKPSLSQNLPANVRFQPMELSEFLERARTATGFNVEKGREKSCFSQCDLRPAYGRMFEDYISGYDFWGYYDIDILWGRIRKFFPNKIFSEYSMISSMRHRMSGYFAFYRNTPEVNDFFLGVRDCQLWLESPTYNSFDELLITNHIRSLIAEDRLPFRVFWDDMVAVDLFELRERPHGWMWSEGRVLDAAGHERACIHFAEWKHSFRSIELGSPGEPLYITRFGVSHREFSQLHYWRWHLPELCRRSYWEKRWIPFCRKIFREYGLI